jgi:hypothetical protein
VEVAAHFSAGQALGPDQGKEESNHEMK